MFFIYSIKKVEITLERISLLIIEIQKSLSIPLTQNLGEGAIPLHKNHQLFTFMLCKIPNTTNNPTSPEPP